MLIINMLFPRFIALTTFAVTLFSLRGHGGRHVARSQAGVAIEGPQRPIHDEPAGMNEVRLLVVAGAWVER